MEDIVSANNDSKEQIVKILAEAFDSDPVFKFDEQATVWFMLREPLDRAASK